MRVSIAALVAFVLAFAVVPVNADEGADAFVNQTEINGGAPGCPFEDEVS